MRKFLIVLAVLGVTACGGEHEDLQTWMDSAGSDRRGQLPPLPEIKPYEAVPYTVSAKLDPFSDAKIEPDTVVGLGSGENCPDLQARVDRNSILEKYPVESMRMIGYLNINNQPMAAIEVPQLQLVKQVKVGDYIGFDFGLVTKVTDQEVEFSEQIQDSDGQCSERVNTLQLQAKEGS
jgi:type IV pilus assembly protein PilP